LGFWSFSHVIRLIIKTKHWRSFIKLHSMQPENKGQNGSARHETSKFRALLQIHILSKNGIWNYRIERKSFYLMTEQFYYKSKSMIPKTEHLNSGLGHVILLFWKWHFRVQSVSVLFENYTSESRVRVFCFGNNSFGSKVQVFCFRNHTFSFIIELFSHEIKALSFNSVVSDSIFLQNMDP